ncbi:PQ-loop repeat-containing protein [Candidatus Saccharibacteria bacterium]|nr:PQ-loop repeat-containing protein [Candidatus Saccharibacteria bacterium]
MLGNILLGIVSACTLISYLPQTIKLLKTKESADISIGSWALWVVSSLAYTLYAIIYSNDLMLVFETFLELLFCLIILALSVMYRNSDKNPPKKSPRSSPRARDVIS